MSTPVDINPDPTEALIADLARVVMHVSHLHAAGARLRLAVTPAEYCAIERYCFKRDGKFWARIMNVPLVVDEDATNPVLAFSLAPPAA
jgi:hypothetical protein